MRQSGKADWRLIGRSLTASVLAASSLGFCATLARADNGALPTTPVSVTLTDAPVKTALAMLFKSIGANYTIAASVTGTVTVDLHNVPFNVALRTVLKACTPPLEDSYDPDGTDSGVISVGAKSPAIQPSLAIGSQSDQSNGNGASQNGTLRPAGVDGLVDVVDQDVLLAHSTGTAPTDFEVIKLNYADATVVASVFGPLPGQSPTIIVPATTLGGSSAAPVGAGIAAASSNSGTVSRSGGISGSTLGSGMPTMISAGRAAQ